MKSRGPTIALCLLKTESWNGANSQSNKVLASGKKMQFDLLYTFKVSGRPFLCTLKKAAFSMYIKKSSLLIMDWLFLVALRYNYYLSE